MSFEKYLIGSLLAGNNKSRITQSDASPIAGHCSGVALQSWRYFLRA